MYTANQVGVTYQLAILASEERETDAQFLDRLFSPIHRSATNSCKLDNGLVSFVQKRSIFVGDIDHRARPRLVDRSGDEKHWKDQGLIGPSGHCQLELGHRYEAVREQKQEGGAIV